MSGPYVYRKLRLTEEQYSRWIAKARKARTNGKLVLSRRMGAVAHVSCSWIYGGSFVEAR